MTDDERENVIKQAAKQEASDYQSGDFEQGAWWALSNLSALGYDIAVANPAASAQPVALTDDEIDDAILAHWNSYLIHPDVERRRNFARAIIAAMKAKGAANG